MHALHALPSRAHWKLDGSVAVNVKVASVDVPVAGPLVIVVSGGVVSAGAEIVQLYVAGVGSLVTPFDESTEKVCEPRLRLK